MTGKTLDQARQSAIVRPDWSRRLSSLIETVFVRHRTLLSVVHAVMFLVFLGVIFGPLFLPLPPGDARPWNNFTSFASYALWGLWFPLVFLSVIFTGRSWCGVFCPMGAAAEWANSVGPQWPIPRWLRWEGTPVVSFLIVTILGQTVGVRDHAEGAAEVFGGTMLTAILVGFLWGRKKRAWCRHACPIGLLLGVFSRLGAVQFAPRFLFPGGEGYTEKGVCPTMIDLTRKTESRHCIECFRCVNPTAKGGVHLELRKPGEEIERIREHHANPWEVWFLFMGTGIALGGFLWLILPQWDLWRQSLGEWALNGDLFWLSESGPSWLMSVHPDQHEVFLWLDFLMIVGFMLGCMVMMAVVLGALTLAAAWLSGKVGGDERLSVRFTELGYQFAPVAMVSLVVGLGGKLFDLLQETLLSADAIHLIKGVLFGLGLIWSLYLGRRILARQGVSLARGLIALVPGLLGSLFVGLCWWPAIFGL